MSHTLGVVAYGEAIAMFVATAPGPLAQATWFTKRIAGADLDVAVGLSRLGFRVGYMNRVGQDSFGEYVLETLARERIDASCIAVNPRYLIGFQLKACVGEGNNPHVEYFRKSSAASRLSRADYVADYVLSAHYLHLAGVAPAISASSCELAFHLARKMRAVGGAISFDPNPRPTLWPFTAEMVSTLNALASLSDQVLPGLAEGQQLTGYDTLADIARFYLDQGAQNMVIKLDAAGTYYRAAGGVEGIADDVRVACVTDTVSADNGFTMGVVSALLEELSPDLAITRGSRTGALAIQVIEDFEGLPIRTALEVLEQMAHMIYKPEPISNV